MKFLTYLFSFYINSSIHVAFSVVALAYITTFQCHIFLDVELVFFLFFSTITGYNFVKYFGVTKFHYRSLTNKLRYIQVFTFCCCLVMGYFASQLNYKTLFCVLCFGIVTFLYAIPVPFRRFFIDAQHNLRDVGGLKIYLIAFIWTGVTVFLPLVESGYAITVEAGIIALQRFIFIIVLMFPFEIRDLSYDSLKLGTIPQKIGVKRTKVIGFFLLSVMLFFEFLKGDVGLISTGVLMVLILITSLFLWFSKMKQSKYYTVFWVESLPVFWFLLLFIFD